MMNSADTAPGSPKEGCRKDLLALAALAGALGVIALLVGVAHPYPINDDWAFAYVVAGICSEGKVHPSGWIAMTLIAHALWGAVFVKLLPALGIHGALRAGVFAMAAVGAGSVFVLLRDAGRPRWLAWLTAFAVFTGPISLPLTFTFMTDITYLALSLVSLCGYVRWVRSGKWNWAVMGAVFAIAATLVRQYGVLVPVAAAAGWLLVRGLNWKALLFNAGVAVFGVVAAYVVKHYFGFLSEGDNLGAAPIMRMLGLPSVMVRLYVTMACAGLTLLPLLPLLLPQLKRRYGAGRMTLAGVVVVAATAALLILQRVSIGGRLGEYVKETSGDLLPPLVGNTLTLQGQLPRFMAGNEPVYLTAPVQLVLGILAGGTALAVLLASFPASRRENLLLNLLRNWKKLFAGLVGVAVVGLAVLHRLPLAVNLVLIAGLLGAWLVRVAGREPGEVQDSATPLIAVTAAFFCLYVGVSTCLPPYFYDRYALPAIAALALLLAVNFERSEASPPKPALSVAAGLAIASIAVTVVSLRGYFAFRTAAWELAESAVAQGVQPDEVDGGFEWSCWHASLTQDGDQWRPRPNPKPPIGETKAPAREYIVSFSPLPAYVTAEEREYQEWFGTRRLLLLKNPNFKPAQ